MTYFLQFSPFIDRSLNFINFIEQRKGSIVPLLRHSIEQAISAQDETLSVVAKNLGQWIDLLQVIYSYEKIGNLNKDVYYCQSNFDDKDLRSFKIGLFLPEAFFRMC